MFGAVCLRLTNPSTSLLASVFSFFLWVLFSCRGLQDAKSSCYHTKFGLSSGAARDFTYGRSRRKNRGTSRKLGRNAERSITPTKMLVFLLDSLLKPQKGVTPKRHVLWLDEICSHHFETRVETISRVGISLVNRIIPGVS